MADHYIRRDEVQIIDREHCWKVRKINEAARIKMSDKGIRIRAPRVV